MSPKRLPKVAYFCMEYGLHEELPIYAGGLGILAGDYIKAAGELKVPLVALGILWRHGYGRQRINGAGLPEDFEQENDLSRFLEMTEVEVVVPVEGRPIHCQVWRVDRYGNAPLFLLEPRDAADRWITERLYGGPPEHRIAQELLLGVGGVRALRAMGMDPDVYHFNEGHAVFAALELISEQERLGLTFDQAWAEVRRKVVFTTHTPVAAGNESHPLDLLLKVANGCGWRAEDLDEVGGSPFNMTGAGLRLSSRANAVSDLHGETARHMWQDIPAMAPIGSITNGVHPGTWQDVRMRDAVGGGGTDDDLWATHQTLKGELLAEVQQRTGVTIPAEGLLIGFARRAAGYKRADLILRDEARIGPLLREGRVRIVFSGKAHPHDEGGQWLVARLVRATREFPGSVLFLEDYDMKLAKLLTRGCDVWLNNPRRPLEASGTSGMKAAMNGVLNWSILDGWWAEGCHHGVNGWRIGDGASEPDLELADRRDEHFLYRSLEEEVLPTYADRPRWCRMMRASVETTQWAFSSDRMVQQYFSELYVDPMLEHRATG
jgi:starch phosphorylase